MKKKSLKEQVVLAAEDESGAESAVGGKRKTVSKRSYLNEDGSEADKIEEATGARYQLLGEGGESFDMQFGNAGSFETMCGIFGFHTKVGNVANTVLNDKDEPGGPAEAAEAIRAFIESATDSKSPVWAERAGGVGIQIDKDALAGAVVDVAAASGKTVAYDKVRQKIEEDKAYLRMVEIMGAGRGPESFAVAD